MSWLITMGNEELVLDGYVGEHFGAVKDYPNDVLVHKFRLLDDDGITYFEGLETDSSSFDPLDYFGMPEFGCTDIQYWEKKVSSSGVTVWKWESL